MNSLSSIASVYPRPSTTSGKHTSDSRRREDASRATISQSLVRLIESLKLVESLHRRPETVDDQDLAYQNMRSDAEGQQILTKLAVLLRHAVLSRPQNAVTQSMINLQDGSSSNSELYREIKVMQDAIRNHAEYAIPLSTDSTASFQKVDEAAETLAALKKELQFQRESYESKSQSQLKTIQELKDKIYAHQQSTEEYLSQIQARLSTHLDLQEQAHTAAVTTITTDTNKLKEQLSDFRVKHKEEELGMKAQRNRVLKEVSEWIARYDEEMTDKQKELDECNAATYYDQEMLRDLIIKRDRVKEQWSLIEKERQDLAEAARIKKLRDDENNRAASKIQRSWRRHAKEKPRVKTPAKKSKKGTPVSKKSPAVKPAAKGKK